MCVKLSLEDLNPALAPHPHKFIMVLLLKGNLLRIKIFWVHGHNTQTVREKKIRLKIQVLQGQPLHQQLADENLPSIFGLRTINNTGLL